MRCCSVRADKFRCRLPLLDAGGMRHDKRERVARCNLIGCQNMAKAL